MENPLKYHNIINFDVCRCGESTGKYFGKATISFINFDVCR